MMKIAYKEEHLHHLLLQKEVKSWRDQQMISEEQWQAVQQRYPSPLYHPNFAIRILLLIATLLAISGATGFFFLLLEGLGDKVLSVCAILYGFSSFFLLKYYFIDKKLHYKSGVNEALLYHSLGFTLGGLIALFEPGTSVILLLCTIGFTFSAWRFLDLLSTVAAIGSFAGLIFNRLYSAGGILQSIIPFVFIIVFSAAYWLVKRLDQKQSNWPWSNVLLVAEALCLLIIYAAGNYFVVRELSISMMGLVLNEGEDIPFAFLFYAFTCLIPAGYLYFGIRRRDVVMLRLSLIGIAFTVFTFRYYYSLGHPEVILTLAGALLLVISYSLFQYLKVVRGGFTRDKLLAEKWSHVNVEAFVFSQTLGGNQAPETKFKGGGGEFGGGGATGTI